MKVKGKSFKKEKGFITKGQKERLILINRSF